MLQEVSLQKNMETLKQRHDHYLGRDFLNHFVFFHEYHFFGLLGQEKSFVPLICTQIMWRFCMHGALLFLWGNYEATRTTLVGENFFENGWGVFWVGGDFL